MAQTQKTTGSRLYPLDKIRNIGIIAHIDAGKTTTTERILYYTGKAYKIGDIDEGTTQMDWMDQEKERGITIVSAATTTFWRGVRINIIDTPGHVDFTAEVERSLRVLDGGVTILDAGEGVQAQSETVWRQANKYNVPRLCFVNKMDNVGADFLATVKSIRHKLGANAIPIQLPIGAESEFKGVVDLLENTAWIWEGDQTGAKYHQIDIPANMLDDVKRHRQKLIEAICEQDDVLLEKYLNGQEITPAELKKVLRQATINYKIVPVLAGSSLRNKGVQLLLDAIVDYLPSPLDVPPIKGVNPKTNKEEERKPGLDQPFTALAFKIQADPHVGRITYLRIYSGKIKSGTYIFNSSQNTKERLGRILLMHANQREEIDEAYSGEIVAAIGLKATKTGDTLCDPAHPIILERIKFAEPVISLAIEPKTKIDQEKLGYALNRLAEEDPTFKISTDEETGQTIISGMGELHLEIIADRLKREFKVDVVTGTPQVAYRETVTAPAQAEGKYIRQSGGRGQYGHCLIKIEPLERGQGYEFVNKIVGGAIPREFIPAVEKGVKEATQKGVLAGYPLVDLRVILYDGSYHEVDSSEMAFKIAGSMALQAAAKKASPILLEPIMNLEVYVPEEFIGDVIGDLSARRAQIAGSDKEGSTSIIKAHVPLAELRRYATILRSLTQGRGHFFMIPSHYAPVPDNIAAQIIESRQK
ncbi:MAG: elongation factor G [bacterium]|nr:elongation factor G [bacterium]